MEDLLAGRREDVVVSLLRDHTGMTAEQVASAITLPSWLRRVDAACDAQGCVTRFERRYLA